MRKNKYKESHLLLFRNLNLRIARLERFALLVSIDSLTSFSPSANAPLGHHSDRSPLHCLWQFWNRSSDIACGIQKKRVTIKVIRFFVEHRRFELLTPTLPVLCATNCANAPNSGYIIITSGLCKAFFSVRILNSAYSYSKVIPAIILSISSRSVSRFSLRLAKVTVKMVFSSLNRMVSADSSTSSMR